MISFGGITIPFLPSFTGIGVAVLVLLLLHRCIRKQNRVGVFLDWLYEEMYLFFADILGKEELERIKTYITTMFFVILLYNVLGLLTDFVSPIFGYDEIAGEFHLAKYLGFATSDYHFNIGMAAIGILIMLGIQIKVMSGRGLFGKTWSEKGRAAPFFKFGNFLYEYVPFRGKNILTMERGKLPAPLFALLWLLIKVFDIVISVFIGLLDIIGVIAKVISLSFRLFGNMLSGTALLTVLVLALNDATSGSLGFAFPVVGPIILLLQGLLVACIQAFVFPLLVAIFIKVARMSGQEEAEAVA